MQKQMRPPQTRTNKQGIQMEEEFHKSQLVDTNKNTRLALSALIVVGVIFTAFAAWYLVGDGSKRLANSRSTAATDQNQTKENDAATAVEKSNNISTSSAKQTEKNVTDLDSLGEELDSTDIESIDISLDENDSEMAEF